MPLRLCLFWLTVCLLTSLSAASLPGAFAQPLPFAGEQAEWMEPAPYKLSAQLVGQPDAAQAYVIVRIELPPESYLYALTQPGDLATRVEVALGPNGKIAGPMRPTQVPKINERDAFLGGRSEKHFGTVHFVLPVQRLTSLPLEQWQVALRLNGQVCSESGSCQLIRDEIIAAKFMPLDEQAGVLVRQAEATQDGLRR
jgi:hypothetical protein